jgi:hypothetical protein
MTEDERKRLLEICHKIINAEHLAPEETIPLLRQLNELLDERDRRLRDNPPPPDRRL